MALITKKDIERLDGIHSETCISIFIPTHRAGEEVLSGKDTLKLKNQLNAVKVKSMHFSYATRKIFGGIYNLEKRHVRVDEKPLPSSVSLLNKAAIKTFLNGDQVYLLEKDEMPNPYSKVNALFRY